MQDIKFQHQDNRIKIKTDMKAACFKVSLENFAIILLAKLYLLFTLGDKTSTFIDYSLKGTCQVAPSSVSFQSVILGSPEQTQCHLAIVCTQ